MTVPCDAGEFAVGGGWAASYNNAGVILSHGTGAAWEMTFDVFVDDTDITVYVTCLQV